MFDFYQEMYLLQNHTSKKAVSKYASLCTLSSSANCKYRIKSPFYNAPNSIPCFISFSNSKLQSADPRIPIHNPQSPFPSPQFQPPIPLQLIRQHLQPAHSNTFHRRPPREIYQRNSQRRHRRITIELQKLGLIMLNHSSQDHKLSRTHLLCRGCCNPRHGLPILSWRPRINQ